MDPYPAMLLFASLASAAAGGWYFGRVFVVGLAVIAGALLIGVLADEILHFLLGRIRR